MRCTVPSKAFARTVKVPARLLPASERAALFFLCEMPEGHDGARMARRVHDFQRCIATVATSAACRSRPAGWPLHSSALSVAEYLLKVARCAACGVRMSSLFLFEFVKRYVRKEEKDAPPRRKKTTPFLVLLFPDGQTAAVFFRHKKCSPRDTCTQTTTGNKALVSTSTVAASTSSP